MFVRTAIAFVLFGAFAIAETPTTACPSDRPVDDFIAEIAKSQSKRSARNRSPLPQNFCVWGWCRQPVKTPPTLPGPAPTAEPGRADPNVSSSKEESSSKDPRLACQIAVELALEAAHNVEVGDYNFEQKNYRGALSRYREADEQKPADAAILVRMGRAYEKIDEPASAIARYEAAIKLTGPEKWISEARASVERLRLSVPR